MKVKIEQSGGFAGLVKGWEVDKGSLTKDEAEEFKRLIKQSGISKSGEEYSDVARDLNQYEIIIEEGASKIQAIFDDKTLPDSARPLVAFLKTHSSPKPLK
jgi:hypothetical protein